MEYFQYCQVTEVDESTTKERESTKSILKQVFICSTACMQFFIAGLCIGSPTVIIPQLEREGVQIGEEMVSWIYTATLLPMLPWVIVVPMMSKKVGRKVPQIISSVTVMISYFILYFSESANQILVSEIFQGFLHASNITVTILSVTEYSSPRYRGLFLTLKSASFFWGVWVANFIGTFYHWKNIVLLGIACTVYTFNVVYWPESPVWLANKGRINRCKKSFRWLHGSNKESDGHLRALISSQREIVMSREKGYKDGFYKSLNKAEFYKPLILSIMSVIQNNFTGKIMCSLYILDIFKKITENETSAYTAMLILDGLTVFGMYFGSFLSKILNRRTLYIYSSLIGVLFIFTISLYLFLVRVTVFVETIYVTVVLLTLYSVSISCGPMILTMTIYGELVPIKYQESCYIIISLTYILSQSILIKLAPQIFTTFGVDGTFLFFGVVCGLCTIYLYMYLPETKDKTQYEIELYFKDKNMIEPQERIFKESSVGITTNIPEDRNLP